MPYFTRPMVSDLAMTVQVIVGVSQARRHQLNNQKRPIPQASLAEAMIDTGASTTCVDPSTLQGLDLSPIGTVELYTPSTGSQPVIVPRYVISLVVITDRNQLPLTFPNIEVLETDLSPHGFHALLGRDILQSCLLSYNGQAQTFTLAY